MMGVPSSSVTPPARSNTLEHLAAALISCQANDVSCAIEAVIKASAMCELSETEWEIILLFSNRFPGIKSSLEAAAVKQENVRFFHVSENVRALTDITRFPVHLVH
jgi:hypothetical protein